MNILKIIREYKLKQLNPKDLFPLTKIITGCEGKDLAIKDKIKKKE